MADDTSKRGPQDRSQVNMNEDYEVRFWTKELGVSEEERKRLIAQHGNSAEKVREAARR